MKTTLKHLSVLLACAGLIAGCSTKPAAQPSAAPQDQTSTEKTVITIGASTSPHAEILEYAQPYLEEKGYTLKIVEFSDYVTPNTALEPVSYTHLDVYKRQDREFQSGTDF